MFNLLVILAVFSQIAIALTVYFKRKGGHSNIAFMLLSVVLACWAFANYVAISIPQNGHTIYAIRTVITFVVLQNTLFYFFAKTFSGSRISQIPHHKIIMILSVVVALLTQTPLIFGSIVIQNGAASPVPNPGMGLFLIHALFTFFGGVRSLLKQLNASKGQKHQQIMYVLGALTIILLITPITNFIITLAFHTTIFIKFSPFYILLFGSFITYTIVTQKLFDIRAAVARSVAYVMSLGFIGIVYGLIILTLFSLFNIDNLSKPVVSTIFIGLALITAAIYPIIKTFFDNLTTKLFYQDAYDSKIFIADINKLLVGQVQLDALLKGITNIIEDNLKTSYCVFVIRETAYEDVRVVGTEKHKFNAESIKELRTLAPHIHEKMLVTDELGKYKDELEDILISLDVAVLIRLISNTAYDLEGLGYLVIGPKKNGSIYNTQDKQVLEILSNEMTIAVENALRFEEIEKFNLTLQQKVDDATSQLKRTNQKLKALDETKDEFISMASHQLRTPLTSVKGYLSMVLEGDAGKISDMQRKLLDQAFVSSQRMVYLIADLLNLSRLKTGKFIIDPVPTNLSQVIEDEVGQLKETAAARNLTLEYKQPTNFPTFMLDETKIRQVMMNFMDNAIYYTPAGGAITVNLVDTGKTIEFTVVDNGIGITKREQPHLFTKFFRAGNAKKARPDGTGLGLFMVKKVIVAQGGSIIFKSQEGKGSTFGFAFEKAKLEQQANEADDPIKI